MSVDTIAASSISARMASYSDSLLEALKPKGINCSNLSSVEDLSCKPMPALVCRDAPSTIRVHKFKLPGLTPDWGISTRKLARTCPFLVNLGLYSISNSRNSIVHQAILLDKLGL